MREYDYVIIGGGMAGGRACDGIRALDETGTVALVTAEPHRPYQRPPLSKGYLTGKETLDDVYLKPPEAYAEAHIDLFTEVRAEEIRREERVVTLSSGEPLHYGKLLIATGAQARHLTTLPGHDLGNVFVLRTIGDSEAIRDAADASHGGTALVLGGSFIGSEVAASLAQRGVKVIIAFPEDRLLARVVPEVFSEHLREKFKEHGIRLLPGVVAERLEGTGKVERAVLSNGETVAIDLAVMGVGVVLDTGLAERAGLEMGERGAVMVDEFLRTSDPSIYAAGDIAAWPDRTFGRRLRVEHWDVARAQGLRAGRNMAGEGKPYRTVPYFFSDLFDLSPEVWGDLTTWDEVVQRGSMERQSVAFFYFREGRLCGALVAGRNKEKKPIQALVRARVAQKDVAATLADPKSDLAALAE